TMQIGMSLCKIGFSTVSLAGFAKIVGVMSKKYLKFTKRVLAVLFSIILFPIFGCLSSIFWASGGNTFWKPINYFPLPVENVLYMDSHGNEFWV
ncbi:MAG TPA: hypothetical protein PLL95_17095, partial [Anaerolineales bacterium]|nr:hypothetical protein [Anaerolineales bacterium]